MQVYSHIFLGAKMAIIRFTSSAIFVLAVFGASIMSVDGLRAQENNDTAQETGPRFQIERDGKGFVRLDKKSGATSFCRQINDDLVCRLAIEERDTFYNEITDLQDKLATLRSKLDALDSDDTPPSRPNKDIPNPNFQEGKGAERDDIEKEMDKVIDVTKRTVRKLFQAVKELQKELEKE